ncbi:MAG: phospholipid carrier-dependent glycosyltransferase [Burkholderiales bacterium]
MNPPRPPSRARLWLLIAVLATIWFSALDYRKLVRPDEGRYAEVAREMVASGDWVTPRLNDFKYFYKPALQYWATATAFTAFGEHEWTARLWSALTGFFGVLMTAWVGARLWGRATGIAAGSVTAGALLYALIGQVNTLDMGVTFFSCAGIFAFILAQLEARGAPAERRWMLAAWAALALAVMSKGLIGAVLPLATLVLYSLATRDLSPWRRMHWLAGVALFLAICAPWFVLVTLRNPEFFHFFFIHEHFERFLTKVHRREAPAWYFIPLLLGGIAPWTLLLFGAAWRAVRQREADGFKPRLFLILWCAFIFAFFSASSSKLPSYILPMFPALALLIADFATRLRGGTLALLCAPWIVAGVAATLAAPRVTAMASQEVPAHLYAAYAPWLLAATAVFTSGATLATLLAWRGRILMAIVCKGGAALLAAVIGLAGHDSLSPASSAYHLASRIAPEVRADVPFFSLEMYEQTLPFYLKRTVTLVQYRDEMGFGIDREPHKWAADYPEFARRWRAAPEAFAILHPGTQSKLDQLGLPYEIIARDTRRLVIKKPAPPR